MALGGKRLNAGRKKGSKASHTLEAEKAKALIIKRVVQSLTPILDALIAKAESGDIIAIKELFDRAFGKAPQAIIPPNGDGELIIRWQS